MQDPGLTDREDFITGTGAAAVGGVTTVIDHHRTIPFVLRPEIVREKTAYLASRARVDYALLGGAHPDNIDQLRPMWEAGVVGFKVFTCNLHGVPAALPDKMLEIFRTVASFDGVCLVHAEDEFITRANEERLRAAGAEGLPGDPGVADPGGGAGGGEHRGLLGPPDGLSGGDRPCKPSPCVRGYPTGTISGSPRLGGELPPVFSSLYR
jgi:dihydroorotase-like cyclic amidohydrolase